MFFLVLQSVLFLFMVLHDWVHIPPLTDIRSLEKKHSVKFRIIFSMLNGLIVLIPLLLTWYYAQNYPLWAKIIMVFFYGLLTLGTLLAWWVPYLFGHENYQWMKKIYGSMKEHKVGFEEYRNTHHFLPKYKNNLIPNTFHVLLHLQIWTCFIISLGLL